MYSCKPLDIKAIQAKGEVLEENVIQHQIYSDDGFDKNGRVDSLDLTVFTGKWLETGL